MLNGRKFLCHYNAWLLSIQLLIGVFCWIWIDGFTAAVYLGSWVFAVACTMDLGSCLESLPGWARALVTFVVDCIVAYSIYSVGTIIFDLGSSRTQSIERIPEGTKALLEQNDLVIDEFRDNADNIIALGQALKTTGPFEPVFAVFLFAIISVVGGAVTWFAYKTYLHRKGDYHPRWGQ